MNLSKSIKVDDLKDLIGELRLKARQLLFFESNSSMTATALAMTGLRRAKLKDVSWEDVRWENREHFFATVSIAMRRALVDYARQRSREPLVFLPNDDFILRNLPTQADEKPDRIILLEEALSRIAKVHPDLVEVIQQFYYAGYTTSEMARFRGVSEKTIDRDLKRAREILRKEMESQEKRVWPALSRDSTSPFPDIRVGSTISSRYSIREHLGQGGMGVVWRATDKSTHTDVALKTLYPSVVTPQFELKFRNEIETLKKLDHPRIIKLFDSGVHLEQGVSVPFFTMELLMGPNLRVWGTANKDNQKAIMRMMAKVCDALDYTHHQGVYHMDLKPDNILVKEDSMPTLLDFGISFNSSSVPQRGGSFAGTMLYASPEQLSDDVSSSFHSSDVFSVGLILLELLTGVRPPALGRTDCFQSKADALSQRAKSISDAIEKCPRDVKCIIQRTVSPNPEERPSLTKLAAELIRASDALVVPAE